MTKSIPAGAFLGGLPVYLLGNLCPISERNKQVVSWGGFNPCCFLRNTRLRDPHHPSPAHAKHIISSQEKQIKFSRKNSSSKPSPSSVVAAYPSFPILSSSLIDIPKPPLHVTFPFKLAQHIRDMKVITMRTWVIYTKRSHVRPRSRDCWLLMQCTPKIPSPFDDALYE